MSKRPVASTGAPSSSISCAVAPPLATTRSSGGGGGGLGLGRLGELRLVELRLGLAADPAAARAGRFADGGVGVVGLVEQELGIVELVLFARGLTAEDGFGRAYPAPRPSTRLGGTYDGVMWKRWWQREQRTRAPLAGMRASATWKRVLQFSHSTVIEGPHPHGRRVRRSA